MLVIITVIIEGWYITVDCEYGQEICFYQDKIGVACVLFHKSQSCS